MKNFFCVLAFGLIAWTGMARDEFAPVSPRRTVLGDKPVLKLVEQGRIGFEIVAGKTPAAKFAAREAATVLGRAFGKQLAVRTAPSGKVPALLIGTVRPEGLDRDGFVIRTEGRNVVIAGVDDPRQDPVKGFKNYGRMGERGTIHGVYAFLERFAGARFYFPGELGTVVPRRNEWTLPAIDIADRPDWRERKVSDGVNGKNMALTYLRNRFASETIPNCHGLAFLGFIERFGKTHPEYFALQENGKRHMDVNAARPSSRKGHICLAGRIRDEIVDDAIAFLSGKPAASRGVLVNGRSVWSHARFPAGMPYFNIMFNDCFYRCRCPECWKHFSKGPQETSNYVWRFFSDIGRKVKASGVPGKLTTMAYEDYKLIPQVEIPDNILVMLALRGPWNENNAAARNRDEALLRSWNRKLGSKVWLWTYPAKWSIGLPAIPNVAPRAVGNFYQRLAPYIFGAYMEAETDRPLYNYLNFYIFGKVAWDNSADIGKLLDEHHKMMFGAGAPMMKEFYESLERHWMSLVGNSVETPMGPVTVLPQNSDIWGKIFSEAELKRLDGLFAAARRAAAKEPESLKRLEFIRREFYAPLAAERGRYMASRSAREAWKAHLPATFSLFPLKGEAEVKTRLSVSADERNLYFKFDCEEPHTNKMIVKDYGFDHRRVWENSSVELFLNPSCDRKTYYQIEVAPSGSLTDLKISGGVADYSWNSGAKAECRVVPGKKWTASITVPRKVLEPISEKGMAANFFRYRTLSGKKIGTSSYHWCPTGKRVNDIEEWGRLVFAPDTNPSLVLNGDFAGKPDRRFLGRGDAMWFAAKAFPSDRSVFLTENSSIKLTSGVNVAQYLKTLKPDTRYVLSFYVRLDKVVPARSGRGFNVRFDEGNGHVTMFPRVPMTGSAPWTRMECVIQTHAKVGGQAYVRFQFPEGAGAAWVDHVRLHETGGSSR